MDEELTLTRAALAQKIGFSQSVLRKWEQDFAEFVTSPPGQKGLAKARIYPAEDIILFSLIAQLRSEGFTLDKIRELLPDRLAQARAQIAEGQARPVDYLPPEPDEREQQRVALTLYLDVVRQLEATEGSLVATTGERDYLRERVAKLEDKVVDAERRAAAAEAQRDMLAGRPPVDEAQPEQPALTWWQRFIGGGKKSE